VAGERFELANTCGQLNQRFAESAPGARPVAGERVLYLIDEWPPAEHLKLHEEVAIAISDPNILPIAARLGPRFDKADRLAPLIEFLPDGIVLEAEWRADPSRVAQLEEIRNELGTAVDGEQFFMEARRALRLVAIIEKRDIPQVHFARADGALCAWLVKRLSGCRLSGAIEERPASGRGLLATIASGSDLTSVSDPELGETLKSSATDHLNLQRPETHRRIGPFRVRNQVPEPGHDAVQAELALRWLSHIVGFS
ncbi:MAG: hypothetical protein ACR2RV_05985, partial [Verrucomicrobiales bacterium]